MKKITFNKRDYWDVPLSLGRNGYVQTHGLEIHHEPEEWPYVAIYPVTSKGFKARCKIKLPKEHLSDLISALKAIEGKDEHIYLLFGEIASREYHNYSGEDVVSAVLEAVEEYGFGHATFDFDPSTMSAIELLAEYDGWDGYAVITKDEYEQFNKQ